MVQIEISRIMGTRQYGEGTGEHLGFIGMVSSLLQVNTAIGDPTLGFNCIVLLEAGAAKKWAIIHHCVGWH